MPSPPQKISDGLPNAKEVLGDRYTTTCTDDGKIWFISREGVNQQSISWFHETPLQGASLVYFDTHTKTWSQPQSVGPMSTEELLEGDIIGYKNHLLLLTYNRSKMFQYLELYEWKENKFQKIDQFEVDEKTKLECGDYTKLHKANAGVDGVYLWAESGWGAYISRLQFDGQKASIKLVHDIPFAIPDRAQGPHVVQMCIKDHQVYFLYGQQGCGFRWEADHPCRVNLQDGKVDHLRIGTDEARAQHPPWSFSGPRGSCYVPPNRWFFLGGTQATGMSSTKEETSIWIMDLDKLEWKRCEECDMPPGTKLVGACKGTTGSPLALYVGNPTDGIYEIDPK